jgi:hypothetical protein
VDGTPREGTEEIVAILESVIKRDPNHLGAIHYNIHSVETSESPERALAGANRLAAIAPAAGHIVHMPAHVYIRTGDYAAAVQTNPILQEMITGRRWGTNEIQLSPWNWPQKNSETRNYLRIMQLRGGAVNGLAQPKQNSGDNGAEGES